jgi:hypothetical protein
MILIRGGWSTTSIVIPSNGKSTTFWKFYHDFKNRGNPYLVSKNQTLLMIKIDIGLKN